MGAVVKVGVLLQAMSNKGWRGTRDAAIACGVATGSFKKLMAGQLPRLDVLFRIAEGCGLRINDFVVAEGMQTQPADEVKFGTPSVMAPTLRQAGLAEIHAEIDSRRERALTILRRKAQSDPEIRLVVELLDPVRSTTESRKKV